MTNYYAHCLDCGFKRHQFQIPMPRNNNVKNVCFKHLLAHSSHTIGLTRLPNFVKDSFRMWYESPHNIILFNETDRDKIALIELEEIKQP